MYQPFHDYVQCTRIVIENRVLSGTSPFTFGSNYVMLSTQTNVALLCTPIIKDVALAGLNSATHKESIESPQPPRDYSNLSRATANFRSMAKCLLGKIMHTSNL